MPRYRISFAREWTLGRWGFLDRFFHDLGGRESEPSKLANAWVVDYRGNARRLGRELASALNIQESDYQKFGPIFDIEELQGATPRPSKPREEPAPAEAAFTPPPEPEPAPQKPSEPEPSTPFTGPTWAQSVDVEDIVPEAEPEAPAEPKVEEPFVGASTASSAAMAKSKSEEVVASAKERREDLFRIRKSSKTLARHRADAISGAARRKPPVGRSPLE